MHITNTSHKISFRAGRKSMLTAGDKPGDVGILDSFFLSTDEYISFHTVIDNEKMGISNTLEGHEDLSFASLIDDISCEESIKSALLVRFAFLLS